MKRLVAALWICFGGYCGYNNVVLLAFGMTRDQAAAALGVQVVFYSAYHGSEIYVAYGSAGIRGFYPVDSAVALQFRNGHLTGWKNDWRLRRPWPF